MQKGISKYLRNQPRTKDELAVPRFVLCYGSLVILDVVCRYLSLFLLYINIEIGTK